MTTWLVSQGLFRAVQQKRARTGLIHYTDRGSQYCAKAYRALQVQFGMQTSMSRKGNCFDNALIESFWGSLKNELVHHHQFNSRRERRPRRLFRNTLRFFITANVGTHDLAMPARQSSPSGIGELLRLLDSGLSDLVRTPQLFREVGYLQVRETIKSVAPDLPEGQAVHVFRHTFASHFMMSGGNILALQKILGHHNI